MPGLSVRNMTRRHKVPAFPFADAAKAVLPGWDISLALVGRSRAKSLNESLRKKSYVPNVLSYATGKSSGEVVICLEVAERQAPRYGMSYPEFAGFLLIHALLHLKGMPHGARMERAERTILARVALNTHAKTHRNRNRHRHIPDKGRRH